MKKFTSLLAVILLFSVYCFGQGRTINGTVKDETGATIPGASIKIKGTRTGVASDNAGQFRIIAKTGDVLIISGANLETKEVTISEANVITVQMQHAVVTGTEVVVTALGIRKSEKALGYAVSKVDPASLLQKSEPDLLKSLQGKVPGVDIRTSQGTPGASTRIQIRGNSSFGLETQPLIVVDGVPYSNDEVATSSQTVGGTAYGSGIADLDPNDIETFNVLKGAAAASLYGSRASRGVILITTKSGSAKKGAKSLNVNFKTSMSVEKIANLPEYQNEFGAGTQTVYQNSNGSWGPRFGLGNVYDAGGNVIRPSLSGTDSIPVWPEYLAAWPELFSANGYTGYRPYPNNVKDLFRNGGVFENSIGVNGGDANSSVGLTVSNLVHRGYVENTSYVKNNISLGGQVKYKALTIGGNLSYARSKQKGGFFGENQVAGAASQFARSLFLGRNWDLNLPYEDVNGHPLIPNGGGQFDNPHWAAQNNTVTTIEERMVAGFHMSYKFSGRFTMNYTFGANALTMGRDEKTAEFSRAAGGLGRLVEDSYKALELQSTLVAVWTPKVWKDFSLEVKAGNDFNQRTARRQTYTGSDFIVPGIFNLVNTATQSFDNDSRSKRRIVGFFADASWGYKNFAFINVAARNDRTSTLPYKNASYIYPGISGSLVFTDAFKIRNKWLDYGKLRLGWAKVGNDAPPNNGQDVFVINPNFLSQPSTSLNSQTVDPNLTPEFTKELEAGLDLSFFKRRINLEFTAYRKITTDLIYPVSVPGTSGYGSFNTNIGEISNKGIEIGLNLRPVITQKFTWEIRTAFTKNKNIVEKLVDGLERTSLGGGLSSVAPYLEPGKPFGYLRGTKVDRTADGLPLINPTTGFMIQAVDQGQIGDPNPDFKLGVTNVLSYKGFTFSCLFDLTMGGDLYSATTNLLMGRGVTKDTRDRETSWVIDGVYGDPNTHQPIMIGGKPVRNQTRITTNDLYFAPGGSSATFGINSATEFNIFDATVYHLRELTLGYEIPKKFVQRLGFSAASISLSGHNLWHLAPNFPKYTRFDPEVNSYGSSSLLGMEFSAAPTTRRMGVNLNVTF